MMLGGRAWADNAVLRREALSQFDAQHFGEAAGAFAATFVASGDTIDLVAWAQSERMWGQCDRAIQLYSLYLSSDPPAANREAAVRAIARCSGKVDITATSPGYLTSPGGKARVHELIEK